MNPYDDDNYFGPVGWGYTFGFGEDNRDPFRKEEEYKPDSRSNTPIEEFWDRFDDIRNGKVYMGRSYKLIGRLYINYKSGEVYREDDPEVERLRKLYPDDWEEVINPLW